MGYLTNDDDEEMQLAQDDAPVEPMEAPQVPPAPMPPPVDPEAAKMQLIKDQLSKEYNTAKDDTGIKDAQDKASHLNNIANIGDALESIFKSNSMAHGGAGVDSDFYKGLKAQGATGVQQAQATRNAKVQDFLQQHEINRQVASDMMTKGTYEQQQKAAQYTNDAQDPASRTSKNSQNAFKSIFKDQPGISDMDVSKFSSADLTSASKNADVVAKLNEIKATKQMQLQMQQSMLGNKQNEKSKQAYTDATDKVAGKRAPQFVQQAMTGVLNGNKAMDIINNYPDANKMPQAMVSLLNEEMTKIAAGGVGSEHGLKSVEANTLQSNWNNFLSKVKGEPTGADLGSFIQANKQYLESMLKTNKEAVKTYNRQIYNGAKPHFTPELDAQFQQEHPDLFEQDQNQPAPVSALGQQQKKKSLPAFQHPAAQQASVWAKANPNDPRAKEILKRLGAMNASN